MTKTKVVLIGGRAGSGKNTVGNMMRDILEAHQKEVLVLGNGDTVREYAKKYFDLEDYKNDEGRVIMLGITNMMYDLYPNYYEYRTYAKLLEHQYVNNKKVDYLIITDWRFPCTYEFFKKEFDVETIYLHRQAHHRYSKKFTEDVSELPETLAPFVQKEFYNGDTTLAELMNLVKLYTEGVLLNGKEAEC